MEKDICPACGADRNFDYKPVVSLFKLWKDDNSEQIKLNTASKVLVGRFIKKYGYESVREAFIQAGINPQRQSIEYVRGILMKKEQQLKLREHMMQTKELRKDDITTRSSLKSGNNSNYGEVDEENSSS